ncbi:flavin monoamine oxidase family protein [Psychrobacter sp. 72-O-c]|uniref:flavin monoamine oxidase family protein n=1 Tax=Psychrobacter sp. 72-O-c TaxID=2774125 RepID=UPI00191B45E0|nr:FAD-dependent oxidoreductase [Psychrobacter sp. 72-O-c]
MKNIPVAIVGGGLSGLYAAFLLEQKSIDYILLEARTTLGGRIVAGRSHEHLNSEHQSSEPPNSKTIKMEVTDSFDLGPSWFWPDFQQQLGYLIEELNLESFAQFEDGDMMVERSPNESPIRTQGYKSSPPSMRLKGGMAVLINALYSRLDSTRVLTGQIVRRLTNKDDYIELASEDSSGKIMTWQTQHVLLALPPRLAENSIEFTPALPKDMAAQWRETATWMAPHAKYFAVYDTPFWREQGLSGEARSALGPLNEIHDASIMGGSGALFGFLGVPAEVRQSVSEDVLKAHCRAQLERLFGAQADSPKMEYFKDWSQDPFTATTADANSDGQHASAPIAKATSGVWKECLTGIGSEWSQQFPGYTAGAIEAASFGVQNLPESPESMLQDKVSARSNLPSD